MTCDTGGEDGYLKMGNGGANSQEAQPQSLPPGASASPPPEPLIARPAPVCGESPRKPGLRLPLWRPLTGISSAIPPAQTNAQRPSGSAADFFCRPAVLREPRRDPGGTPVYSPSRNVAPSAPPTHEARGVQTSRDVPLCSAVLLPLLTSAIFQRR